MVVRFEYWQSEEDGQWYFDLHAPHGGIIIQSMGYQSKDECLDAIDFIRFYADIAPVVQPDVVSTIM